MGLTVIFCAWVLGRHLAGGGRNLIKFAGSNLPRDKKFFDFSSSSTPGIMHFRAQVTYALVMRSVK